MMEICKVSGPFWLISINIKCKKVTIEFSTKYLSVWNQNIMNGEVWKMPHDYKTFKNK